MNTTTSESSQSYPPLDDELLAAFAKSRGDLTGKMVDFIFKYHAADDRAGLLAKPPRTAGEFSRERERLMLKILEENDNPAARGSALYSLARAFLSLADFCETIDGLGIQDEEYARLAFKREIKVVGQESVLNELKYFHAMGGNELRVRARTYVKEAVDNYRKERIRTFRLDRNGKITTDLYKTVGRACESLLYQLDHVSIGKPLPEQKFTDLRGDELSLRHRDGKMALVDFWSSSCGPCKAKMPYLSELHESLDDKRFEIIALNVDREIDTLEGYLSDNPLPFRVCHIGLLDPIIKNWDIYGYPTLMIVDTDGILRFRATGTSEELLDLCLHKAMAI